MAELRAQNATLSAQVEKLTADAAAKGDEVKALKAKLKPLEEQAAQGDVKLQVSNSKMDEHIKKLEQLMEEVAKVKAQALWLPALPAAPPPGLPMLAPPPVATPPERLPWAANRSRFGLGSNPFADANW